jgi:hypothetical protein
MLDRVHRARIRLARVRQDTCRSASLNNTGRFLRTMEEAETYYLPHP